MPSSFICCFFLLFFFLFSHRFELDVTKSALAKTEAALEESSQAMAVEAQKRSEERDMLERKVRGVGVCVCVCVCVGGWVWV
jgi:hypothetical protein